MHYPAGSFKFKMFLSTVVSLLLSLSVWLALPDVQAATTLLVTNTNDSGTGSLRAAVAASNAATTDTEIRFQISGGSNYKIITLASPLPEIRNSHVTLINGFSQSGATLENPVIRLDGANRVDYAFSLNGNATIQGFMLTSFNQAVKAIGNNNLIQGNRIGLGAYDQRAGNNVGIFFSSGTAIGGEDWNLRNVISGNQVGIRCNGECSNTYIRYNYVGLNTRGEYGIGNTIGIQISNSSNNPSYINLTHNVVSGNTTGIDIDNFSTSNIDIHDSYIGTDKNADFAVPNQQAINIGKQVFGNISSNVISGNVRGVKVGNAVFYSVINFYANKFGTKANGRDGIPNLGYSIYVDDYAIANVDGCAGGNNPLNANIFGHNQAPAIVTAARPFASLKANCNIFFDNRQTSIDLDNDGLKLTAPVSNSGIVPPTINSATLAGSTLTVTGTAAANSRVEVYHVFGGTNGQAAEGDYYYGAATADGNGIWQLASDISSVPTTIYAGLGSRVTATATLNGHTSETAVSVEVRSAR